MLKKSCLCFILFSIFIFSHNLFAYLTWNEKTKSDFEDGYFFRSTVTTDGVLKVCQWDDWWDTSWPQRIPIEINTVGINETLYDYQIWFVTNTKALVDAGKLDPAGTAIRIAGPDGKTLIPFWIENWNITTSTGSKIWVKVPQIPPNTKTQIYMYIRNVSTNSLSDKDAVFDLYEDWETGQIRNVTPWSATGWVMGGYYGDEPRDYKFEIHTSTDVLYKADQSTGTLQVFEGKYCVRSSTIPHAPSREKETYVYLQTSINLSYPARVEFYWACYSESVEYDYLSFYVGADEKEKIGGNVGWRSAGFNLLLGENTLRWKYRKDYGGSLLFDRGFVDKIVVRKYNSTFDSQIAHRVVTKEIEVWSQYFKYAEYWSNVFDTQGENTKFIYSSWTEVLNGQTVKIYARSADYYFTILSTYPSFSTYELPNNGDPSGLVSRGRYIQYKIVFYTDGTETPEVSNINFTYQPLPLRAYDFNGIALSSTSIKWSWTPRATYYIDGYRIYSLTRQYNKDGGYLVITSTAEGLIAELPPDATYWIEENLQPNTQYGRYVVAYTTTVVSFGGNASRNIFGKDEPRYVYTLALAPQCAAERYIPRELPPPNDYQFEPIPTEVWLSTKEFSFTSAISTGVGRIAYYRYIFKTTTTWDETSSSFWYPSSQTYITGAGREIIERPMLELIATENSDSWYFQVKSYNYDGVESGYQIIGPFWFKGCPAQITTLVVSRGKGEEGTVKLTWSAPTDDADEGDLENAKFVIKYRLAKIIDTMEEFENIKTPVSTSTGMVQGIIEISTTTAAGSQQTYIVTGLVPGLTYWFTIVTVDSNGNWSQVATYINPQNGEMEIAKLRSRASKVARIKFETPSYTFYAGDASPKIKVILVDEDGDLINSRFGAECDLLTTSSKGKFSLDGINFGITKLYILAGSSSYEFYYMDEVAGNPIITIEEVAALEKWSGKQGWSSASQTHTVLPGKAITFRVIPKDGSYNCQIQVDKPVYIEAVDKLGNVAVDFEGVAVVTTTFNGVTISPSVVNFTLEDNGRKEIVLRNLYYAGASSFTVNEVVTQDYKKMLFLDYYNGYVVANKGMLKTTAESGVRWFTNIYRNDPSKGLNSIAVSNSVSILCGVNGLIIRSTDSFVTYTEQNITSETLNDVVFINSTTLVVCGNNGTIYKSTDTGVSFYPINSGVSLNLNSIVFVSTSVGFVCGNNGVLLKTTDAAESFIQLDLPTTVDLYNIKFLDEQTGFICGKNSTLLKTEDGGANFSTINVSTENITLYSIDFITPQIGVVCGSLGKVFISTTAGESFVDISPENSETETFYTIKMLDLNKIIVAGTNGNIFLTTDRGKTWQKIVMQGSSPQDYLWNATIISSFETKTTKVVQGRSNLVATVGLRFMYPSDVVTRINKVTVKKLGSLPDEYITAVRFGDYGSGSFLNGVAEILLPAQPIIRYDKTSYFNIFVDLSEDAPLDTTIALKFDFGCINVSQGIQFGRNNLPFITTDFIVEPPEVNVYIVKIDTAVYLRTAEELLENFPQTKILEQGDHAIITTLGLITEKSKSPFRKLRINLTGTNIRDEDIKIVKLYVDYPFKDENLISTATFSGGVALLSFLSPQWITTVTNYYFITAEISPESSYSRDTTEVNFSFRIDISTTFFLLDTEGVNTISSKISDIQTSIRSETVRIEQSKDIVYAKILSDLVAKIPEKVYQSERIVLLPIGVSVGKRGLGLASADWTKLTVEKSTTAADKYDRFDRSSQTVVEVWHDENGDGSFDVGIDRKLGSSVFENNTAVVLFSQPEKIDKQHYLTEYATYFIICYIPKNAQPNEKLKLIISTGTSFTLGGVDITESSNFPLVSPEVIIADYPDEVETKIISLAPVEAALYEQNVPIAAIDLVAFCDATLDKLVITSEGTAVSSFTVKLVKVFLDDGDLKFDETKDVLVASSTFDLLGRCDLVFFNPQQILKYKPVLVLDEKVRIFLVFDLYENALPDKTIGVGFDPTGFNYNLPNRQKPFGYFSTQKVTLLDKRTPTKPAISPTVFLKQGIDTGKEIERKIYYTPYSNEIKFSWYSEAPYGGGIKSGYVGLATRKYIPGVYETPDIVSFKPLPTVGEFDLSGLNLEHNKLYYLWVKAESNAGFRRINYVPIFIDVTSPQPSQLPQPSQPSNNIYWINCNLTDDDESFLYSVEIEERVHQENIWNTIDVIPLDIQNLIKDIYFGKIVEEVKGTQIIISSRNIVSDDVVIEYNFVLSSSVPENVEVINFKTLFASLGYKLESYNIKLSYRLTNRQQNKVYYYRIKTKNIAGSVSAPSQPSKGIALSLPRDTIVELTTFPNPCDVRKRNFVISYILSKDVQEVNIKIFDLFGNLVFEKSFYKGDEKTLFGTHYVECDKSKDIPAGMYILVLETKDLDGNIERKKWKLGVIR